jgi:hypothetical protein
MWILFIYHCYLPICLLVIFGCLIWHYNFKKFSHPMWKEKYNLSLVYFPKLWKSDCLSTMLWASLFRMYHTPFVEHCPERHPPKIVRLIVLSWRKIIFIDAELFTRYPFQLLYLYVRSPYLHDSSFQQPTWALVASYSFSVVLKWRNSILVVGKSVGLPCWCIYKLKFH